MGSRGGSTAKLSLHIATAIVVCLLSPKAIRGQILPIDAGQYAAKAMEVSGRVSVLRDSVEYAIEAGGEVRVKELIFTGSDGHGKFQVSDGSTFEVFPNSRVVFRKNVPNWQDMLDLLVGRIKVQIQHLGDIPNHNRILTPTAVISVRGTIFDVSVNDDDETTTVEVEEGVVAVQHALLPGGNPKMVTAADPPLVIYRNVPIASNGVDKGEIFKRVLRMGIDALNTWESRVPRGIAGIGGGSSSGAGDTKKPPPPPSAPTFPGVGSPGFSGGHSTVYAHSQPQPKTRWQKVRGVMVYYAIRFVFGTSPEDEVIRAIGNH
jgi:hypothetical protein